MPVLTSSADTDRLMTWTRLDDGWYEQPVFDDLPHEVRWHYLALIQTCSRNQRYDGRVPAGVARRCSDVSDPATAHAMLAALDLIAVGEDDGAVTLLRIEDHIPPPHYRDEERKARQREDTRRHRAHKAGHHDLCLPGRCKQAVSTDVSAYTGTETGRNGDVTGSTAPDESSSDDHLSELAQQKLNQGWDD